MAASSSCCILLVYGIPGSGKTILTDYLCAQALGYSMLPIHFDSFYPPDNRIQIELESLENDGVPFEMKQERQQVCECIDRFVQLNVLGHSAEPSEEDSRTPQLWDTFVSYLQEYRHIFHIIHPGGKIFLPSPSVLVLDDNLPLRSMRYQFFQMARKYQLGFGEVCICCEVPVAQARNAKRQNPIPNSTIISMERRLELPEPFKHHWERRSSVVHNTTTKEEFLRHTLDIARELISEALANPEQPTSLEEGRMKEACRVENLESYLHQADIIFRKCVSTSIKDYKGSERSVFAHRVNSIRKELLEEARTGDLFKQCRVSTLSTTSSEFETTLRQLFSVKLESQLHI